MLPAKEDVLEFVNACKRKAVTSVVNETEMYCLKLIDSTSIVKEAYQKLEKIKDYLDSLPVPDGYKKYYIDTNRSYREPALYREFISYTDHSKYDLLFRYVTVHPECFQQEDLNNLNELLKKIIAVKDTYNGLAYTIKKMKKVDRMIGYLQELGYDTTHLCGFEMRALDKSLLFVCKDNKPDVES